MRITKRHLFSFLFLLLISGIALAQTRPLVRYAVEHGLPSNTVRDLVQDHFGFIWIGTNQGLCRFDGHQFMVMDESDGFEGEDIREMEVDSNGTLWVNYGNNLQYRFRYVFTESESEVPPPYYGVESMTIVNGNLYAAIRTKDSTIVLRRQQGKLARLGLPQDPGSIALHGRGEDLFLESAFQVLNFTETKITSKSDPSGSGLCSAIMPTGEYIYRGNKGLVVIQKDGEELPFVGEGDFSLPEVSSISVVDDIVWFGTAAGLYKYDGSAPDGDRFLRFRELDGKLITRVLKDRDGGLWFATAGYGVYYLSARAASTTQEQFFSDGIPSGVQAIEKSGSNLFLGFSNGDLKVTVANENQVIRPEDASGVTCIYPVADDLIIFGTKSGLKMADIREEKTVKLSKQSEEVHSISLGIGGRVWIAIGEEIRSVRIIDLLSTQPDDEFITSTRLIPYSATVVLEDPKSEKLLIGRQNGLWEWHEDWDEIKMHGDAPISYPVSDMVPDEEGRVWVSTKGGGVWVLDGDGIKQINKEKGLSSDHCNDLMMDAEGNCWVATDRGVSRISTAENDSLDIFIVNRQQGLQDENARTIGRDRDVLMVGTAAGLFRISISALDIDRTRSNVVVATRVDYDDRKIIPADTIELPFDGSELTVGFSSNDFEAMGQVSYEWRLEGSDEHSGLTDKPFVRLRSMPGGEFTLKVKACDGMGNCGQEYAVMVIHVPVPFWRQWPYIVGALGLMALIAILWIGFKTRGRRAPVKVRDQSQLAAEAMAKEMQAELIPEISLDAIRTIRDLSQSKDNKKREQSYSLSLRMVELLRKTNARILIPLTETLEIIWHYVTLQQIRSNTPLEYDYFIDEDLDLEQLRFPPMLIVPFIRQAALNISQDKKKASINLKVFKKEAQIVLEMIFKGISLPDGIEGTVPDIGDALEKAGLIGYDLNITRDGKTKSTISVAVTPA